eukprot:6694123-Alexandrium_andersonii.AAC.1
MPWREPRFPPSPNFAPEWRKVLQRTWGCLSRVGGRPRSWWWARAGCLGGKESNVDGQRGGRLHANRGHVEGGSRPRALRRSSKKGGSGISEVWGW